MLSEHRPSLGEWPHRFREGLAGLRAGWREWREGVRQEPARLWHSPLTKIGLLIVLGLLAILAVQWFGSALVPGGLSWRLEDQATREATLFVACTNPACRASYTTQQPRDFKDWPLKCEKCGQQTVYRATHCRECRHWYALTPGGPPGCPFCAQKRAEQKKLEAPPPPAPEKSDDSEDPW
jgi:hypothetical protein